jgi:hypothetical protein
MGWWDGGMVVIIITITAVASWVGFCVSSRVHQSHLCIVLDRKFSSYVKFNVPTAGHVMQITLFKLAISSLKENHTHLHTLTCSRCLKFAVKPTDGGGRSLGRFKKETSNQQWAELAKSLYPGGNIGDLELRSDGGDDDHHWFMLLRGHLSVLF